MVANDKRETLFRIASLPLGLAAFGNARAVEPMGRTDPGQAQEVVRTALAIHIETRYSVPPERVYRTLTDAELFQHVVTQSDAFTHMPAGSPPAAISPELGGAFSLFGGYITGRHLVLDRPHRLIQAWRTAGWDAAYYSVISFELTDDNGGTYLKFNQSGFPPDEAQVLVSGWHLNYLEAMRKSFAA